MAVNTHQRHRAIGHRAMALAAAIAMGLVGALSAPAQQANFESFTLTRASPMASVSGFTTGIFALSNIAGRDRNGIICTGFADTDPDHIMVLQQDVASLTLQVNSGGNDTSLLIQGPNDGTVRCGEDIDRRNPDAQVRDQGWSAGTYKIWVGSHSQGQTYNYSLSVGP